MRLSVRLTSGVATLALISAAAAAQAQTAPAASSAAAKAKAQSTASSAPVATNTVKEVIVTGYRASLASAQQRKEHASQIVDSVVAPTSASCPT